MPDNRPAADSSPTKQASSSQPLKNPAGDCWKPRPGSELRSSCGVCGGFAQTDAKHGNLPLKRFQDTLGSAGFCMMIRARRGWRRASPFPSALRLACWKAACGGGNAGLVRPLERPGLEGSYLQELSRGKLQPLFPFLASPAPAQPPRSRGNPPQGKGAVLAQGGEQPQAGEKRRQV